MCEEQQDERFVVDNDEKAAWAMRKLHELHTQMRANERVYDQEKKNIDDWLQEVNGTLVNKGEYFRGLLLEYQARERDKRKTIKLPHGTLKSRSTERIEIDDEFVDWAACDRDDLIVYQQPKPNMNEIKRLLKAGESIPHCQLVESVSFSLEVKE